MNSLIQMYLAAERENDLERELRDIHLQDSALQSKSTRSNSFERSMYVFGQWLVLRGEKIVKRYEIPAQSCQRVKNNYAH